VKRVLRSEYFFIGGKKKKRRGRQRALDLESKRASRTTRFLRLLLPLLDVEKERGGPRVEGKENASRGGKRKIPSSSTRRRGRRLYAVFIAKELVSREGSS